MAAQIPPKAELIAIYRLEFYKKQKKWKLSADARKEKEAQKCTKNTKVMNQTYCIETNVDDELPELNDAFLKDDSDKESPVTSAITLKTQLLEPIHACQECKQRSESRSPWANCVQDTKPEALDTWKRGILGMEHGDDECDGFDEGWEGMEWTNSAHARGCNGDTSAPSSPMPVQNEAYRNLVWEDNFDEQIIPWPDDQLWRPEVWDEDKLLFHSLEDVEDFLIGAHSAPHSSEIELCVADNLAEDEAESNLGQLSAAQLALAAQRHAAALQMLLREEQKRRCRSTLSLDIGTPNHYDVTPRDVISTDYSYEVFPTRDTGFNPLQTQTPNTPMNRQVFDGVQTTQLNMFAENNGQLLGGGFNTPMNLQRVDGQLGGAFNTPMNLQRVDGQLGGAFNTPMNLQRVDGQLGGTLNTPMNLQRVDGQLGGALNVPMSLQSFDGQLFGGVFNTPMNLQRVVDGFVGETFRSTLQIEIVGRGRGRLPPGDGQMRPGGV